RARGLRAEDFRTLGDLRRLPVLTKETVASHLDEFVSRRATIQTITCTSGTTGGHRLPRFVGEEELEACALLARMDAGWRGADTAQDIVLRVVPSMRRYVSHGRGGACPQVAVTLSLHYPKYTLRSAFDDFVLKQFFERFPIPGSTGYVTIVH